MRKPVRKEPKKGHVRAAVEAERSSRLKITQGKASDQTKRKANDIPTVQVVPVALNDSH